MYLNRVEKKEVSKASYFMVAFVVCLYGWSPAVTRPAQLGLRGWAG